MIVFKTMLKIFNKNKLFLILYTGLLIFFTAFSLNNSDSTSNFSAVKPTIVVINNDKDTKITNNLIKYIKSNSEKASVKDSEEARDDALFYEDIHYVIYIPKNYTEDFLNHKNPTLDIKKKDNYYASLSEQILTRYIKVSNTYLNVTNNEDELISLINDTLSKETTIKVTTKLDTNKLAKANFYYNFTAYSVLASLVYIICVVLSSFKCEKIRKRTSISSMNYKKHNRQLLLSNSLFSLFIWIFYVLLSFILIGDTMKSSQGLVFIINLLIFIITSTTLAFLLGNIINNKNTITSIINVLAIGSSFLCGVFVPVDYLPESVVNMGKILPTHYYVNSNNLVMELEKVNFDTLKPIINNMIVMIIFSIVFIVLTNIIAKKKRRIG